MTLPPIIPTARLLELLNEGQSEGEQISRTTLYVWITTDPRWRGCIAHSSRRKFWLSTQRLQDCGILPRAEVKPVAASFFTYAPEAVRAG